MNVEGRHFRTIWLKEPENRIVQVINQQILPFKFEILDLCTVEDVCKAIKDMYVRGAGLIGAAAAYGMYLAALDDGMIRAAQMLKKTRPTAANLARAVDRMMSIDRSGAPEQRREQARREAQAIADEDAEYCRRIGLHGLDIIKKISEEKGGRAVNILTHCNAGWLAFVDYGSALAPVYAAFDQGIDVHVWVDETRPRNQGASLTAWELAQHGVSHDLIPDNAGGHLMQHGLVDMVITGADRVTRQGDAANKIGTYLKAVAATENNVPFYVALPSSTFDFTMRDGVQEIPIEERDPQEIKYVTGKAPDGSIQTVLICPETTAARNWGFDVTPARFITALITERGMCAASEQSIMDLFPGEGYVKYTAEHTTGTIIEAPHWAQLNEARTQLHKMGLVGVTADGIGFGNVSIRYNEHKFIISGTATGAKPALSLNDYCIVNSFDVKRNCVVTSGPIQASSESMTHGAVYQSCPGAQCVIHIHAKTMFDGMIRDHYPSTPQDAGYGTPEIALAIAERVRHCGANEGQIVLAGHDEGVIAYGPSVERVYQLIVELYTKYGGFVSALRRLRFYVCAKSARKGRINMAKIGIIGGSGLDNPDIFSNPRDEKITTPYGEPSSALKCGTIGGVEVILLARHGREHTIPPTQVNYRANIAALKAAGCSHIIATTAVGSLREEIHRGDLIIIDQFIDFTKQRKMTYHESFEPHNPVHCAMADPYDEGLRTILINECRALGFPFHERGTVITIEGPRFSTRAESRMFRTMGADIINMSIATETVCANESGIPYAAVAMSTDYDSWRTDEEAVSWEAILEVFNENAARVTTLLKNSIPRV